MELAPQLRQKVSMSGFARGGTVPSLHVMQSESSSSSNQRSIISFGSSTAAASS
jgi:hypothetical protein